MTVTLVDLWKYNSISRQHRAAEGYQCVNIVFEFSDASQSIHKDLKSP